MHRTANTNYQVSNRPQSFSLSLSLLSSFINFIHFISLLFLCFLFFLFLFLLCLLLFFFFIFFLFSPRLPLPFRSQRSRQLPTSTDLRAARFSRRKQKILLTQHFFVVEHRLSLPSCQCPPAHLSPPSLVFDERTAHTQKLFFMCVCCVVSSVASQVRSTTAVCVRGLEWSLPQLFAPFLGLCTASKGDGDRVFVV